MRLAIQHPFNFVGMEYDFCYYFSQELRLEPERERENMREVRSIRNPGEFLDV